MTRDTKAKLGLLASILTALGGAAHILPEGWSAVLVVAGVIGTAISGYIHQAPINRRKSARRFRE